ncbi:hypothetical protein ACFXO9_02375 [Nocardia tengchongensis]|uniref:hypothetical protein n=1 Tax=Nocardia tengchongensis TaxID=2055889 RepID=UPI00368AB97B
MWVIVGIVLAAFILIAVVSSLDKKPSIGQADPRDSATAAAAGGQIGWPTPQWPDQHKANLGPEADNGRHTNPIHGTVSGFHFVSYRTQWSFHPSSSPGVIFSYHADAVAIVGISQHLPDLEIISAHGDWRVTLNERSFDDRKFTSGDADFDTQWSFYSGDAGHAKPLLTAQAKEVLTVLDQTVGALRIRVHGGVLHAWFKAKEDVRSQDQAYLRYLQALSVLARILNAAAHEHQPNRY